MELSRFGDRFALCAGQAERLATDTRLDGPPWDTIISRHPRGVATLIVPWNWPLSILGAKLPQALIAGPRRLRIRQRPAIWNCRIR